MTQDDRVQYKFMIPSALKERLENAAHDNRRSLSAEVIERLTGSFDQSDERTQQFEINIKIDASGMPVSAIEAVQHAAKIASLAGIRPISVSGTVINPGDDTRTEKERDDDFFAASEAYSKMNIPGKG